MPNGRIFSNHDNGRRARVTNAMNVDVSLVKASDRNGRIGGCRKIRRCQIMRDPR